MRDKPLTSFQIDDERLAGERFAAGRTGFELVPRRLRSGPRQLSCGRLLVVAGLAAAAVAISQLGLWPHGSSKAPDEAGHATAVGERPLGSSAGRAVPLVLGARASRAVPLVARVARERPARERGRPTGARGGAAQRASRRGATASRSGNSALRGSR